MSAVMEIYSRVLDCQKPAAFPASTSPYLGLGATDSFGCSLGHAHDYLVHTARRTRVSERKPSWPESKKRQRQLQWLAGTTGTTDVLSPKLGGQFFLTQAVQVKLELGHRASLRRKQTNDGYTHDWTMFVRGPEGCNIMHFVEKVVFHLHESFPKPKRVVKEPPYQVSESGYGSFQLPVEIYFRNKEEPKKIRFDYDLFLHLEGSPPVNHTRCEKLTFQNPNEDFRRKLIKAGGVGVLTPGNSPTPQVVMAPAQPSTSGSDTPESKAFKDLFGAPIKPETTVKKEKSSSKSKSATSGGESSSSSSHSKSSSSSSSSSSKTEKHSKEKAKRPTDFPHVSSKKASESPSSSVKHSSSPSVATKSSPSVAAKSSPSVAGKPFPVVAGKRPSESSPTVSLKRLADPSPSPSESASKKKKHDRDTGSSHKSKHREKEREREREKEREREREKEKSSHSSKDKERSSKHSKDKEKSSRDKKKKEEEPKVKAEKRESCEQKARSTSTPTAPAKVCVPTAAVIASKPLSETRSKAASLRPFADELSTGEQSEFDPFEDSGDDADPGGLLPPSLEKMEHPLTLTSRGGNKPINRLLAQLESEDSLDDDDILSPMSRASPPALFQQSQHSASPRHAEPKTKEKVSESRSHSKKSSPHAKPEKSHSASSGRKAKDKRPREHRKEKANQEKESREKERREKEKEKAEALQQEKQDSEKENRDDCVEEEVLPVGKEKETAPNGEDLAVLLELQQRLMTMTDRRLLQRVVSVIEETGMYKIGDASFDFDLCILDRNTVGRLKTCLEAMSSQC